MDINKEIQNSLDIAKGLCGSKSSKNKGYSFKQAKKKARKMNKSRSKVTYGTKTKRYHFIDPSDKDFNTPFSMPLSKFLKIKSSSKAKNLLTGARII